MKRKLLLTLTATILTLASAISVNAKQSNYYTMTGTVHNFTYVMHYENGTVLKGNGFDIITSDGSIWQMNDTDTDLHFKEGTKVKVKFNNNGTRKDKTDDIIVSVKRIAKGE